MSVSGRGVPSLLRHGTVIFLPEFSPSVTFPYVSRVVGADGIGKVTFVTSVVTYFSMFAIIKEP